MFFCGFCQHENFQSQKQLYKHQWMSICWYILLLIHHSICHQNPLKSIISIPPLSTIFTTSSSNTITTTLIIIIHTTIIANELTNIYKIFIFFYVQKGNLWLCTLSLVLQILVDYTFASNQYNMNNRKQMMIIIPE